MSMPDNARKRPEYEPDGYAAPKQQGDDPLAELARLIGQSDPFAEQGTSRKAAPTLRADTRSAPEWLSRPTQPHQDDQPYDDYRSGGYQQPGQYADDQYQEPQYQQPQYEQPHSARPFPSLFPGAGRDNHTARDQQYADQGGYRDEDYQPQNYQPDGRYHVAPPPAGDYDPDTYYAEDGHMPPGGEAAQLQGSGRRNTILMVAAVVGLAVVGTAGAFGYRAFTGGSGPANPPVIKADPTPAKIVPAAQPQLASASDKPFQERIGATATAPERVVPREEQPVSLPIQQPRAAVPAMAPQTVTTPLPPAQPITASEPKRVKTMTIRPDGTETTSAFPPPPGTQQAARAPAGAKQTQQGGQAPIQLTPPPPDRTRVASRTPSGQGAASGAYVVQVSAQRTEAEAQSSYRSLQAKYPAVLSGREANIRRVDLGDKGGVYFRAQVGAFATQDQATTFCNSLKEAGGQCIVQRN
jgi:hypothetical protein